MNNVSRQ